MSTRGAGLRALHLQPGHPSRDADVLPPAWHRHDSAGMSLPLQGPESPAEGCCLPRDPRCCPEEGRQAQTPPGKRDARVPLPELVPAHSPCFWGGLPPRRDTRFSRHSLAHGRQRACLPDTPQLCRGGRGPTVGSKVGWEGLWLFTQARGPRCWRRPGRAERLPALLSLPARRARCARFAGVSPTPCSCTPHAPGWGGSAVSPGRDRVL